MKVVVAVMVMFSMLFCCAGITYAEDIQVVTSLADLESIVNSTWVSNSINRLMPPAKDCMYENHLGAVAYANDFDTNFISALTPVVLYDGTNEFFMYPVEVIETTNGTGRIRNYYSAISTNPVVLYSNEVSIANYPESWIEDIYGEPPVYLIGSGIQDWYDACDPMRQHVLCDLLSTNSVPYYLSMLTNSVGYYTEGTNTNSVVAFYSNCIAVVQCNISAGDAELYLHAPDDISMLDVYNSTNLLNQYGWNLIATLEHNLDPLRYVAGFDTSSYYSLGNGVLDSDGDGLLDARELILFGTDPDSADSDGDGLSDGEEIFLYRIDPLNSDTDGDGLTDGWEVHYGFNPYDSTVNDADADPDNDGLSNSEEYLLGTDPCNPDSDGDGRSDGAENSFGTDPCKFDTDGDGLSDGYEDNRRIVMWGDNFYGQCNVPTNLPDIVSVACGGEHTLALKFDGTIAAWGRTNFFQCDVPEYLTGVKAISAGYNFSAALKRDGTVEAWGDNSDGQCDVPVGLSNVVDIACGYSHVLALKSDGTVVAWGDDYYGQSNVPTSLYDDSVAIGAGAYHSLAIYNRGPYYYINYIEAWGHDNENQCSDMPSTSFSGRIIDGGNTHSVAVNHIGGIIAWGNNTFGQCNVPASLSSGVSAISTMFNHTLALKSDGTVAAWGQNTYGQCNVPSGLSDVTAISAGTTHNAALEPSKLNSLSVDTDGDLLPDGWEVDYGLDPLVENNIHTDVDDDDLDLFDEYRYVTDPTKQDTDGDGVSDGEEVPHGGAGSNPNDPDDYGSSSNCVTMLLTVGDPSGSNSERWSFNVFDGDKAVVRHVDDGFGTPGSNEYALVKGKEYIYKIEWVATDPEDENYPQADYDWQALINGAANDGVLNGLYNTGGFIVEDPEDLLTSFGGESGITTVNYPAGKVGRIIIPKVDLDVGNGAGGGPDGDIDDPEDGVYGYIPGDRDGSNVLSWANSTLTPQHLKLVAVAPGMSGVEFEIVSCSTHLGFSANTTSPDASSPDYDFGTPYPFDTAQVVNGKAVVDFYCNDFGGKCRVKFTLFSSPGNAAYVGYLDIPRDEDDDGISDQWEEDAVREWNLQYSESHTVGNGFFAASEDKEKADPDGSGTLAAHATTGDSLTVMQEYRGFMFGGLADWGGTVGYKRLSPARKNLLIEVENMVGYTGCATKTEIVSAMATLKSVFLSSTGAEVDYAMDNTSALYADFTSYEVASTYRTAHRGYDEDKDEFKYSEFLYLLFCEKDWEVATGPIKRTYGRGAAGWLGGNVYCTTSRVKASDLSSFGITFSNCIAETATHEMGHCVKTVDHRTLASVSALQVNFSPLDTDEDVIIDWRSDTELTLQKNPTSDTYYAISLVDSSSDTIAELAEQINNLDGGLSGYSATVLNDSGDEYSYTICTRGGHFYSWVTEEGASLWRWADASVMESPERLVDQVMSPTFANAATGYVYEVQLMDFKNKE